MSRYIADIDSPDHAERVIAAMQRFIDTKTVGGVFHGEPDGPDFNAFPGPVAADDEEDKIIVRFESVDQFREMHTEASRFEDKRELEEVDMFNKQKNIFRAWSLVALPSGDDEETWVILVQPQTAITVTLPNIGESCHLRILDPVSGKDLSMWWLARRMPNNFSSIHNSWSKYIAFSLTLSRSEDSASSVIHALVPHNKSQQENLAALKLTADNSICVGLFLSRSSATFDAEMAALSRLHRAAHAPATAIPERDGAQSPVPAPRNPNAVQPKQISAFKYLMDFNDPAFAVNVFEHFPHMQDPIRPRSGIPEYIWEKYHRLNEDQVAAYFGLLSNMPCGVGMLPGGPGGGKTEWAMTVIGLLQSKTTAKVLYLLDINNPLDDATAKYIEMMQAAGLVKKYIRMRTFGTELKRSVRVGPVQNRAQNAEKGAGKQLSTIQMGNNDEPEVDFSKNFLKLYMGQTLDSVERTIHRQSAIVTLDEAAWSHYEENKADFEKLTELLKINQGDIIANGAIRREIYLLYKTVLREADFIATTPCVAATAFKSMFAPDLVVFDEAAHARELSTLISIANFCPTIGWLFLGDHRQTQPMVKSHNENPYEKQLATSVMERAHLAGVLDYQLLINHRAYGRLERLPSKLIYDGKMKSGIPFADRFPPCATFVRDYFYNLCETPLSVPRLIVHLSQADRPSQVGTSWYHQQHMDWTMQRVLELLQDRRFRSAENMAKGGTILLLAPYKAAVTKYQEAIETLAVAHPNLNILGRVEARTWDSAQGHEADIVGIDYVRDHVTDFMDGMYRFNVGLTRARQGEWHLMHPRMPTTDGFRYTRYLRKLYAACRVGLDGLSEGRVVHLSRSNWSNSSIVTAPPVDEVGMSSLMTLQIRPAEVVPEETTGEVRILNNQLTNELTGSVEHEGATKQAVFETSTAETENSSGGFGKTGLEDVYNEDAFGETFYGEVVW